MIAQCLLNKGKLRGLKTQAKLSVKGFTLLELLVVLAIVAITAASAVLYLIPDTLAQDQEREAKRLFHLLRMLEDEAIMQSTEYGVDIFADGYRFLVFDYDSHTWSVIKDQRIYRPYILPEGLHMVLESQAIEQTLGGQTTSNNTNNNFDSNAESEEQASAGQLDEAKEIEAPPIWVLSSGELSEFKIAIYKQDGQDAPYEILGYETGEIALKTPYDD